MTVKRAAILLSTLALTLVGCSAADSPLADGGTVSQDEFLSLYGLAAMDSVQVIDHLDQLPLADRPEELMASVRVDELLLSKKTQEISLDLPENLTYVSLAPYLNQTHDCFYHSLTTCTGELGNEPVHVTFTDDTTGTTLVDEQTMTFDNGFIGFWVPRDTTGTIEVTHEGRTGTTEFSTADDGATCVTDLRLT